MKKWMIFVISALSALVLLLSSALIALARETKPVEEVTYYPVAKFYHHSSESDWFREWTLEEAVDESALVAICNVSEILPTEPVINYDPETGEELYRTARTPAVMEIETVLKGDPDQETVTYQMPRGTYIEKIGDEWFVHNFVNNSPTVSQGDRVLIFFTEEDEPVGPLIVRIGKVGQYDMLKRNSYLFMENWKYVPLDKTCEEIRAIVAASE
ncbi:MAG: hypothetical protein E7458_10395 [Ruminococcaceae bacterium]|nr:hypothetical protein [Oscillospiraceae bacterium]